MTPRAGVPVGAGRRLDALDGLRGLAALAIVVLHVWMFDYGDARRPPKSAVDVAFGELRLGVVLFFVLSGFLIYRPFARAIAEGAPRPRLRRYAIRRAARILPAYWVALLGSFVLLRLIDHPRQVELGDLPLFLVFAQNLVASTVEQLDPPMWTLPVEVSFYAFVPVVAAVAGAYRVLRRRPAVVIAVVVGAGAASTSLSAVHAWPAAATMALPLYLGAFGAGMGVAVWSCRRSASRRAGVALIAAGAGLVVANAVWHGTTLGPVIVRQVVADLPAAAGFALVIAGLVGSPVSARALTCAPVRWLGTVSYGLYLLHFPAIYLLRSQDHWPENLALALAAVLAVALPASALLWHLVERPAVGWVRRRGRRARPEPRRRAHPVAVRAPAPATQGTSVT